MKQTWNPEDVEAYFHVTDSERRLIDRRARKHRIRFAILFKVFFHEGRFPEVPWQVPPDVISSVATQLDLPSDQYTPYDPQGKTIKTDRSHVRQFYGVREATVADFHELVDGLAQHGLEHTDTVTCAKEKVAQQFRKRHIELPSNDRLHRLVRSALSRFEDTFFHTCAEKLSATVKQQLDVRIQESSPDETPDDMVRVHLLNAGPGRLGVKRLLHELEKLRAVRQIPRPANLFNGIPRKGLQKYSLRVATEDIREIRRHPDARRYTLLAVFFWLLQRQITDNLLDLLIHMIHKIGFRAEKRVEKAFLQEVKTVTGKTQLLYRIAELVLEHPDETVKDVIYPVIGKHTFQHLVAEFKNSGVAYRHRVHTRIRAAYAASYRSVVPELLRLLEFRSNNTAHRPVLQALELIKTYCGKTSRYYAIDDQVPLDGIVPKNLRELVITRDGHGHQRIDRIHYEICVLQALRDTLRCKEIWVVGADRYRNPDDDLPSDFSQHRDTYYQALRVPADAAAWITALQHDMRHALERFNADISTNPNVCISKRKPGWITVTPLDAQPEPTTVSQLKRELATRWPMTNLLDVLKETDLRVSFTDQLTSLGVREALQRDVLQHRLLLALFALGTNTGLKRISAANTQNVSYKELLYVRRKFIHRDTLRNAIATVVNAILEVRNPDIWGHGTTSCASDAKRFPAWDQNLMTEWHIRYRGRGVMVYWHVEKHSVCIYSQLKTCSSSEVAAMIEGVLRHCTEMEIDKNYTDTHGQSEVAFALCHLLGFKLMPRMKNIYSQKLSVPESRSGEKYSHLQDILTRPIQWDLIRQQYEQMVTYATAIRLGTAETEAILKRFTRSNLKHPTYRAFCELGKAIKTIFLCEYLGNESIRREIHQGLNVVENWNSANGFIFYGKAGEIATNRVEDQEIALLALHLLQNALIYINTLMYQHILCEPPWLKRMTSEDFRALSPLIYAHINPYGTFHLDMEHRLALQEAAA